MKGKILKLKNSNRLMYLTQNEDGTLNIVNSKNEPMDNIGLYIKSAGGIDKVLERVENQDSVTFEEFRNFAEIYYARQREGKLNCLAKMIEKEEQRKRNRIAAYERLKKEYPEFIPATYKNVGIVLGYLSATACSDIPRLSVSYSANQYDCDGKIATAIKLDKPIETDLEDYCDKFKIGAPFGYLIKYRSIAVDNISEF